jgi:16S rRNA (guanine527-N7)-methyltransferase
MSETEPLGGLDEALAADRERVLQAFNVSRETTERLDSYVRLLFDWQTRMNLVARSTLPQVWTRHVADSLQVLDLAPAARRWVDLGSGAGFPGMVIACALADRPDAKVHLIESTGKKCAFLREVATVTGAPAHVHNVRIEDCVDRFKNQVDAVTARALAPLNTICGYAAPLVKNGAQALFLKGQDVDAELTETAKYWKMDATLEHSRTDPHGRIVVIRRLRRRMAAS